MPKTIENIALKLVEPIYDGVLDPANWERFLTAFVNVTGTDAGSLFLQNRRTAHPIEECSYVGFDQGFIDSYLKYYGRVSPWLPHINRLEVGSIRTGLSLVPQRELERTEFHADWLRPQGLTGGVTSVVDRNSNSNVILTVLHQGQEARKMDQLIRLFELLLPHLQRAFRACQQIAELRSEFLRMEDGLNHLVTPVIIMDEKHRITFSNLRAEQLLANEDGIRSSHGHLQATTTEGATLLRKATRRVFHDACDREIEDVITIPRSSSLSSYETLVTPLGPRMLQFLDEKRYAMIIIGDPEEPATIPDGLLVKLFGLAPVEAKFAVSFFDHHGDLRATAEDQSITIESARTYLKHVFAKTGIHRQSELIRLMLSLPRSLKVTSRH